MPWGKKRQQGPHPAQHGNFRRSITSAGPPCSGLCAIREGKELLIRRRCCMMTTKRLPRHARDARCALPRPLPASGPRLLMEHGPPSKIFSREAGRATRMRTRSISYLLSGGGPKLLRQSCLAGQHRTSVTIIESITVDVSL